MNLPESVPVPDFTVGLHTASTVRSKSGIVPGIALFHPEK